MEIRYNLTGAARKELVAAVSEIMNSNAVYMKAPSFAYAVGDVLIDKNGSLVCGGCVDTETIRNLVARLAEMGFVSEDATLPETPCVEEAKDLTVHTDPDRLSIEMPLKGFDERSLENLEKLVASKATLIRKSLGAENLEIVREDGRLCFPWFELDSAADTISAYMQFVTALCEMAKTQKRVVATEKPADSEKFAFRCFLLRLGFIGEEYAAARKILLANLPGSGSFKSGSKKQPSAVGVVTAGNMENNCLSCSHSMSEPGEEGAICDRLFCAERQAYVNEDHSCIDFN